MPPPPQLALEAGRRRLVPPEVDRASSGPAPVGAVAAAAERGDSRKPATSPLPRRAATPPRPARGVSPARLVEYASRGARGAPAPGRESSSPSASAQASCRERRFTPPRSRAGATRGPCSTRAPPWPARPERLGRFLDAESAEVTGLDDPRLPAVQLGQPRAPGAARLRRLRTRGAGAPPASPHSQADPLRAPAALSARRARAWSTRMLRITCAATPKKCARLCQSAPRRPH